MKATRQLLAALSLPPEKRAKKTARGSTKPGVMNKTEERYCEVLKNRQCRAGAHPMIHFRVAAVPVAQPRPRAVVRASGRAGVFGAKASHPVHAFKAACAFAARQAYAGAPLEGPLEISLLFVFERPKNRCWKTRPMPREWHTKKPDSDNCAKSVLDCLSGVIFRDDAQVCVKRVAKLIAAGDEQPHVEVFIRERPAPPASVWEG